MMEHRDGKAAPLQRHIDDGGGVLASFVAQSQTHNPLIWSDDVGSELFRNILCISSLLVFSDTVWHDQEKKPNLIQ